MDDFILIFNCLRKKSKWTFVEISKEPSICFKGDVINCKGTVNICKPAGKTLCTHLYQILRLRINTLPSLYIFLNKCFLYVCLLYIIFPFYKSIFLLSFLFILKRLCTVFLYFDLCKQTSAKISITCKHKDFRNTYKSFYCNGVNI